MEIIRGKEGDAILLHVGAQGGGGKTPTHS